MSGTITRLAFQKHAADRVNVYLDGQYAFALPAIDAARLGVGQISGRRYDCAVAGPG